MPDKNGFFPDERMEVIGTDGGIHIQETYPSMSLITRNDRFLLGQYSQQRPESVANLLSRLERTDSHADTSSDRHP
jgi:hypothetical protein